MLDRLIRLGHHAASVTLIIMVIMVAAEVIARGVFNFSFLVVDEYAGYLLVVFIFLGVSGSLRSKSLLRVEFIYHALPERAQALVAVIHALLCLGTTVLLDYYLIFYVLNTYRSGVLSPDISQTPLFIPQIFIPIGLTLLAVSCLADLVQEVKRLFGATTPAGHPAQ